MITIALSYTHIKLNATVIVYLPLVRQVYDYCGIKL